MVEKIFPRLFQKYLDGSINAQELIQLQALVQEPNQQESLENALAEAFYNKELAFKGDYDSHEMYQEFLVKIKEQKLTAPTYIAPPSPLRPMTNYKIWWAAAAVILFIGSGTYFFINRANEKPTIAAVHYKGDVQPGHNGAILHLSNGNTVVLDSAQDGTVATQGTVQAVKVNGELKYFGKTAEVLYNTVSTDRGRQWQLTLPDGTKVWLNAASSIHYPLSFTGKERKVEITGEAYFEVVHNDKQPFQVKVASQVIKDIGTSFNVNAYPDEPFIQTTLVEGVVMVNGTKLKPGQQAALINKQIIVSSANFEQALAWKNGAFSFDNADIHTMMRQLARWYNVEVVYEGKPDSTPFKGEIGRSLTLAQVLKVLESLRVHFRIEEDKRIVILP